MVPNNDGTGSCIEPMLPGDESVNTRDDLSVNTAPAETTASLLMLDNETPSQVHRNGRGLLNVSDIYQNSIRNEQPQLRTFCKFNHQVVNM